MTKMPKSMDNQTDESDNLGVVMSTVNSRKNNYKSQKPLLEKRRRDRINSSLDELKSLLLVIKQRDPLRYARLEKADILEMVVKHLKDIKKRRQVMIAAMEPVLHRSFKMGYLDCTRATIDFINDIESPVERKQQIIDHVSSECMKSLQNHRPPANFHQHHEIVFASCNPPDHFVSLPLLSTSFDGEMEWPSIEERLGFSPIPKSNFLLPEIIKPLPELFSTDISSTTTSTSLLKIAEPSSRISAFSKISSTADSSLESPSTSGTSGICTDSTPQQSIFISDDDNNADGDDEEEGKLIIDDNNINSAPAWRPWI